MVMPLIIFTYILLPHDGAVFRKIIFDSYIS